MTKNMRAKIGKSLRFQPDTCGATGSGGVRWELGLQERR